MENLGKTIRELRKRRKLTQSDLSALADVSQTYISQIETGDRIPSIEILNRLGEKIGIPYQIIAFLSLDEDSVSEDKRDAFKQISPAINAMVKEFFLTI
jgi:transcriptional regulator with XRE-family HTH domain